MADKKTPSHKDETSEPAPSGAVAEKGNLWSRRSTWVFWILVALALVIYSAKVKPPRQFIVQGDSLSYMTMAYNLYHHGVISTEHDDAGSNPTPSAFLLTACCLSFYCFIPRRRWYHGLHAGIALAALALTRAVFLYFFPVVLVCLAIYIWYRRAERRQLLLGTAVLAVIFSVSVGGWMFRNHRHFGRFYLAVRGGGVLLIRAELNQMRPDEYFASSLFWTDRWWWHEPSSLKAFLLPRMFDPQVTGRIDRSNPDGIYRFTRKERARLRQELGSTVAADRRFLQRAKKEILSHPIRHLLVSLPLAHRGICVEDRYWLSVLVFLGFCACAGIGLWTRNASMTAALLPVMFNFAFHAGITHNIPRYNRASLPLWWAATAVVIFLAGRRLLRWWQATKSVV